MKLTEDKLRKIVREELIKERMKSAEYAEDGVRAYSNGNRDKFIDELTDLLHAAGSLALKDSETERYYQQIQELMYDIHDLK